MGHLLVLSLTQLAWGIIFTSLLLLIGILLHDPVVTWKNKRWLKKQFLTACQERQYVVILPSPSNDGFFDKITEYRNDFA